MVAQHYPGVNRRRTTMTYVPDNEDRDDQPITPGYAGSPRRQDPDTGDWEPAEPLPFYYGVVPRFLRWVTRGRWPK